MELRNEISGLTMGSPFLAKRLTPWTVPDLLAFLVNRGPPWVAQALYSTQATMLPELKAAMSALDPGTDNVSTGFLAALALEHIRCFHCNKFGHRRPECPLYKAGMPAIPLGSEAPAGASGASFVSDRIGRAEGDAPYTRPGVNALSGVTPEYVAHLEQAYVQAQLAAGDRRSAVGFGPFAGGAGWWPLDGRRGFGGFARGGTTSFGGVGSQSYRFLAAPALCRSRAHELRGRCTGTACAAAGPQGFPDAHTGGAPRPSQRLANAHAAYAPSVRRSTACVLLFFFLVCVFVASSLSMVDIYSVTLPLFFVHVVCCRCAVVCSLSACPAVVCCMPFV